ncbi:DMT family transporter [Erwinia sp. S43]|uniref:EamA family transporter n=1 Tax=Pantoea coffeiphila TaxID=1465635 RepID=A0A2S9IAM5_9GAMM|nr:MULTISPECIES: DMT family transporter [Erwiniaceae]MBK0004713.1 DMT family transporter [Erwinia sp. S38]MBK0033774.1 DMT family transporter [Erwinia sp. S43]MBM7342300.1 drug/metabolite transporter (DMT)-like permease [Pantoea coffeiphila]MCW1874592.1 DMT family transporter [Erwinia sp. INIA01]PRD14835.1 EamA family transporter [Pantoea coffeiphila]
MSGLLSRYKFSINTSELVLILITMVWGGTFLAVHHAMTVSGPFFFIGVRFAVAALLLGLVSWRVMRNVTWPEIKAGVLIGIAIGLGYGLQTYGMQTISSSKSAFITAMYVPLVPLMQWVFLRKMPGLMSWIGIALAFSGLLLLAGPDGGEVAFNVGEIATLLSTLAIAAEILLIGASAGKVDVRRVTVIQLAAASIFGFLMMAPNGESVPAWSPYLLYSAVGLGIASAIIQVTMNWAQRSVSPTRATVIYAGEPVWAGVVGRIAGERLPAIALLGGALIVMGVLVSELKLKRKKKAKGSPSPVECKNG